jgi:CheY-like chemotaxis protein
MNLVINASEALAEHAGTEPAVISLATAVQDLEAGAGELEPGQYVALEVSDNGPGMSRDTVAKVFDPFFSTKFAGRGLGLSAVLGIVRGHGGTIEVTSEPGVGTTFRLLFPVSDGPVDPEALLPRDSPRGSGLRGNVLVVDDEATVRAVAASILRDLGLQVVTAKDGMEAVALLQRQPQKFDVVMMDLTMPRLDGIAAFGEMLAIKPDIKVILMSGYDEQDAMARFAGEGLVAFLQKPFTAQALQETLRMVLDPGAQSRGGARNA